MDLLLKQYNDILNNYNNLNNEYIEYLNSTQPSQYGTDLTTVPNYKYTGQSMIVDSTVTSANLCVATCAKTSNCTGATFNKACTLQSGDGFLKQSPQSIAIVSKQKSYLLQLQNMNNMLQGLNKKIQDYYEINANTLNNNLSGKLYAINDLSDNLMFLSNQKKEFEYQLLALNSPLMEGSVENSESVLNHEKAKYWFYALLFIIVLVITIKFAFTSLSSSIETGLQEAVQKAQG